MRTILSVVLTLLSNAALALPTFEYHLLYEDEVVICDSRLIGVWLKPEGEKDLVIKRVDKRVCSVQVTSWSGSPTFHGYLGRMEGHEELFAELYKEGVETAPDFESKPRIIAIITLTDENLIIRVPSDDWLYRMSDAGILNIPHEVSMWIPEHVHITARTKQLRTFILRLLEEDNPETFKVYPRHRGNNTAD